VLESESLYGGGGGGGGRGVTVAGTYKAFSEKISKICEASSRIFASFTHTDFPSLFLRRFFFESRE
jgi:hypothetical protein